MKQRGRPRKGEPDAALSVRRAAVRAFADKGFSGAGLREIAADAGVDPALISYQFGSKLGLWKSIIAELGQELVERLSGPTPADPDTALRQALLSMIDFNIANDTVARHALRDASREPERALWAYEHLSRPLIQRLVPLMEQARANGSARIAHPELALLNFVYGLAIMVVRRERLVMAMPAWADDAPFRAALAEALIDPLFRNG